MKLVRTFSMLIALASASTVYADSPAKAPPPAAKKAPDKAADKPAAKAELSPAEVAKVEKFFNEFVDAFVKNQDSCPKMVAAVNALLDKNLEWLKAMAASGKDMPKDSKEKMNKRMGEVMSAAMKCKDDKGLAAAMQRFMTIGAKKDAPK